MKYVKIFILMLLCYISNINASTINYNLKVDMNEKLHENIVYKIERNTSNEYLMSILHNDIYFNNMIKYDKTIKDQGDYYIVVLSHDYDSIDVNNNMLLKSCFKEIGFDNDGYEMSFYAIPEFKCIDHADNIIITIDSDIDVITSNSNIVTSDGKHIWDDVRKSAYIGIEIGRIDPNLNVLPPVARTDEYIPSYDDSDVVPDRAMESNNGLLIISISVLGLLIIVFLFIKSRNSNRKIKIESDVNLDDF